MSAEPPPPMPAKPSPVPGTAAVAPADAAQLRGWATYRRVLGYVADQKFWFALAAVGFLCTAAGEAGLAMVLGRILDALAAPLASHMWLFPSMMFALAALRALGTVAGDYTLSRVSFRAIHRIRSVLLERLLLLPSPFYDKSAKGHLVSRLTFTTAQLRDITADALKVIVADGLKVAVFLGALFYQNWLLTLVFIVMAPAIGAIVRFTSRRFRQISTRIQDSMGDVTHVASEVARGYREVRIYGGQKVERKRFQAASDRNRRQNLKLALAKVTSVQVIQLLVAAAMSALVWLVFQPRIGGGMTPGGLATYLTLAGALANPIKKLSDVNARLQKGLAAAHDIFAQIDEAPERDDGTLDVERVRGEIHFENVSFAYAPDRQPVLRDVTLTVKPGQMVALVGRSGAGKTTLASLIARFYEPSSGCIRLDGRPLGEYRLASLRRQIALVTQDISLFNDTLANNIAYGALAGAASKAVEGAVRRAQAGDFVANLPDGLQTVVGDDGVLLSGGQRQRVAIARALLKDAPVLILDEATSALDAVSEQRVRKAMEEVMRGRTTIVIAHRLSTVERADLIVVVEDGAVVETGDHDALMAAGGVYAELYESQFEKRPAAPAPPPARRQPSSLPVASTLAPLVRGWYDGRFWPRLLWPLGVLFAWFAQRRRRRYLSGRARAWRAPVPVVVVGNITAGGTGKTPLVIWLARWLAARGRKPGVVSRGYGGKASYPLLVNARTPAALCGDEAALVARRAECPVAVAPDRPQAVRALLASAEVDVVIADDGLQHYALARDVEIAVLDGQRGVGNGLCLPAGPLREPVSRLAGCDWLVANGVAPGVAPQASVMAAAPLAFRNLATDEQLAPAEFASRFALGDNLVAIAGIGNPARFQATLASLGLTPELVALADHHPLTRADLERSDAAAVVVTEKDAERLRDGDAPGNCWSLAIEMRFLAPVDALLREMFVAKGVVLDAEPAAAAAAEASA